jgi:undecaprenyl-diphosphatase
VIDWLYSIDLALFRFGNETLTFGAGDWFFPFITNVKNFYIPYIVALTLLMVFSKKKGVLVVLLLAITITISDQLNSSLLKELFGRIRPCHVLDHLRLLVDCGSGKSFPSSHAVNNFAAAALISYFYKKYAPYLYVFAALVAYSRVYVGVHYPSDIFGGAIEGLLIGWLIAVLFAKLQTKFKFLRFKTEQVEILPEEAKAT